MPEHAASVPGTLTATKAAAADQSRRRRRQLGSCGGAVLETLLISHVLLGAKDTRTDCLHDECRNLKPGGG